MRNKHFICSILALGTSAYVANATNAVNSHPVKIGGEVNCQFAFFNQQDDFRKKLSQKDKYYHKDVFANSGSLKFNYDNENENGLGYGAYIKLNATSSFLSGSSNIGSEVKIYVEDKFGKVELGNISPVGSAMEVNSYSLTSAIGGLGGDWSNWLEKRGIVNSSRDKETSINHLIDPQLPIGFNENTKVAKINYFSPNLNGFTFGITYTPVSKTKETVNNKKSVSRDVDGGYKNIWQPAVRSETTFENGAKFTTAILGEFAKAKEVSHYNDINRINGSLEKDEIDVNIKNLKAWQIGASIDYKGFAFAGAYGDIVKSCIFNIDITNDVKRVDKYWSLGSVYSTDKYGISIKYMQSKKDVNKDGQVKLIKYDKKEFNKFEALSISADYLVIPGFIPYIGVTKFKFRENDNYDKGTLILAGTKIKF